MTRGTIFGTILPLALILAFAQISAHSATQSPAPGQAPATATLAGQKGQELYRAALAAMGGDAYLNARFRTASGRGYGFSSTGELAGDTPFWMFTRFPDAERVEVGQKRDVIELINGDKGWEITYKGPAPMPAQPLSESLIDRAHSLDVVMKLWGQDPKTLIFDQGLNMADRTQTESVAFYNPNGESIYVDFDLDSHLPVRLHWRRDDPLTGGHFDESVNYGNWQKIGGIATPMSTERYQGDRKMSQQFLSSASYAPLADKLFEPTPLKH